MRVSERQLAASLAKTRLELALYDYGEKEDLNDAAMLERLTLFLSWFVGTMRSGRTTGVLAKNQIPLYYLIASFQKDRPDPNDETKTLIGLTDIEVMQAVHSFCQTQLKYMLRYERHGNYDHPAGLE